MEITKNIKRQNKNRLRKPKMIFLNHKVFAQQMNYRNIQSERISLFLICFHFLQMEINKNIKRRNKNRLRKPKMIFLNHKVFAQQMNYRNIRNIYPNRDILITIAEIVNTLEQARSIIQNIVFDTTRISQSVLCIRTSLDEFNYTIEKMHRS